MLWSQFISEGSAPACDCVTAFAAMGKSMNYQSIYGDETVEDGVDFIDSQADRFRDANLARADRQSRV